MDIQLLVLDIDGTIVGDSNQISKNVRNTISEVLDLGIEVVLATGRMYQSARYYHEYLNLKTPIIAYNGAWMQRPGVEEILHHFPVAWSIAAELLDYYEQSHLIDKIDVHFYFDDQLYIRELTPETAAYANRSKVAPNIVGDLRTLVEINPTKVLAFSSDVDLMEKTTLELQRLYSRDIVYIAQSDKTLIECNHPQATKGEATRYLAEKMLGLSSDQVMAIGDNFNDVEMLKYAGVGVAMGDAHSTIKGLVQWVAPTVQEDGVAVAIRKFILS